MITILAFNELILYFSLQEAGAPVEITENILELQNSYSNLMVLPNCLMFFHCNSNFHHDQRRIYGCRNIQDEVLCDNS